MTHLDAKPDYKIQNASCIENYASCSVEFDLASSPSSSGSRRSSFLNYVFPPTIKQARSKEQVNNINFDKLKVESSLTRFSLKKFMLKPWTSGLTVNSGSCDLISRSSSSGFKIDKLISINFGSKKNTDENNKNLDKDSKRGKSRAESKMGIMRSKLYNSFPNLHNINQVVFRKQNSVSNINKLGCKTEVDYENDENVQKVLQAVARDHIVSTDTVDNKIRRTLYIERVESEKFGFTLQSYSFRSVKNNRLERVTYIDYVVLNSPAFLAGLRAGDVIVSINGKDVQHFAHKTLVQYITDHLCLRMVVLFENCVNRVDLCARAVKLKKLVSDKIFEYNVLNLQERRLLNGLPLLTDDEILCLLYNSPDKSIIYGRDASSSSRTISIGPASLKADSDSQYYSNRSSPPSINKQDCDKISTAFSKKEENNSVLLCECNRTSIRSELFATEIEDETDANDTTGTEEYDNTSLHPVSCIDDGLGVKTSVKCSNFVDAISERDTVDGDNELPADASIVAFGEYEKISCDRKSFFEKSRADSIVITRF